MTPSELYDYNLSKFSTLDPRAKLRFEMFQDECWSLKWHFKVLSARRTVLEQTWLYMSGRTRPGPIVTDTIYGSKHLQGLACDLLPTGGQTYEDMESISKKYGITRPLVDSRLRDLGHYELTSTEVLEPKTTQSPDVRLKALYRRLSSASATSKKVIRSAIELLQHAIERRNRRSS